MPYFRKKPVVIEAMHFDGADDAVAAILSWSDGAICFGTGGGDPDHLLIETLEGDMRADIGDWIIKGVKGEFYPCKADIFAATYEQVASDELAPLRLHTHPRASLAVDRTLVAGAG